MYILAAGVFSDERLKEEVGTGTSFGNIRTKRNLSDTKIPHLLERKIVLI